MGPDWTRTRTRTLTPDPDPHPDPGPGPGPGPGPDRTRTPDPPPRKKNDIPPLPAKYKSKGSRQIIGCLLEKSVKAGDSYGGVFDKVVNIRDIRDAISLGRLRGMRRVGPCGHRWMNSVFPCLSIANPMQVVVMILLRKAS